MKFYIILFYIQCFLVNEFGANAVSRYISKLPKEKQKRVIERVAERIIEDTKSAEYPKSEAQEIPDDELDLESGYLSRLLEEERERIKMKQKKLTPKADSKNETTENINGKAVKKISDQERTVEILHSTSSDLNSKDTRTTKLESEVAKRSDINNSTNTPQNENERGENQLKEIEHNQTWSYFSPGNSNQAQANMRSQSVEIEKIERNDKKEEIDLTLRKEDVNETDKHDSNSSRPQKESNRTNIKLTNNTKTESKHKTKQESVSVEITVLNETKENVNTDIPVKVIYDEGMKKKSSNAKINNSTVNTTLQNASNYRRSIADEDNNMEELAETTNKTIARKKRTSLNDTQSIKNEDEDSNKEVSKKTEEIKNVAKIDGKTNFSDIQINDNLNSTLNITAHATKTKDNTDTESSEKNKEPLSPIKTYNQLNDTDIQSKSISRADNNLPSDLPKATENLTNSSADVGILPANVFVKAETQPKLDEKFETSTINEEVSFTETSNFEVLENNASLNLTVKPSYSNLNNSDILDSTLKTKSDDNETKDKSTTEIIGKVNEPLNLTKTVRQSNNQPNLILRASNNLTSDLSANETLLDSNANKIYKLNSTLKIRSDVYKTKDIPDTETSEKNIEPQNLIEDDSLMNDTDKQPKLIPGAINNLTSDFSVKETPTDDNADVTIIPFYSNTTTVTAEIPANIDKKPETSTKSGELNYIQISDFDANKNNTTLNLPATDFFNGSTTEDILKMRTEFVTGDPERSSEYMTQPIKGSTSTIATSTQNIDIYLPIKDNSHGSTTEGITKVGISTGKNEIIRIENNVKTKADINVTSTTPKPPVGNEHVHLNRLKSDPSRTTDNDSEYRSVVVKIRNGDKNIYYLSEDPVKMKNDNVKSTILKPPVENEHVNLNKLKSNPSKPTENDSEYKAVTVTLMNGQKEIHYLLEDPVKVENDDVTPLKDHKASEENLSPKNKPNTYKESKHILRENLQKQTQKSINIKMKPGKEYRVYELLPGQDPFIKKPLTKSNSKGSPKVTFYQVAKEENPIYSDTERKKHIYLDPDRSSQIKQKNQAHVYKYAPEHGNYYKPKNKYRSKANYKYVSVEDERSNEGDSIDLEKAFDYEMPQKYPKADKHKLEANVEHKVSDDYYDYGKSDRNDEKNFVVGRSCDCLVHSECCQETIIKVKQNPLMPPNSNERHHPYNAMLNDIPPRPHQTHIQNIMTELGHNIKTNKILKRKRKNPYAREPPVEKKQENSYSIEAKIATIDVDASEAAAIETPDGGEMKKRRLKFARLRMPKHENDKNDIDNDINNVIAFLGYTQLSEPTRDTIIDGNIDSDKNNKDNDQLLKKFLKVGSDLRSQSSESASYVSEPKIYSSTEDEGGLPTLNTSIVQLIIDKSTKGRRKHRMSKLLGKYRDKKQLYAPPKIPQSINYSTNDVSEKISQPKFMAYIDVVKNMINEDNNALYQYDWLGTTVDIRSAIKKITHLSDVINKDVNNIHPKDLQLLKYILYLFSTAMNDIEYEKERYLRIAKVREDISIEGNSPHRELTKRVTYTKIKPNKTQSTWPPKNRRRMLLERPWLSKDILKTRMDELMTFVDGLGSVLDELHSAIKYISLITTYRKQNWFKNLKELYLNPPSDKKALEVALHLEAVRMFDLIEASSKNGLDQNYVRYALQNPKEVNKATEQFDRIAELYLELKKLQ